MKLIEQILMFRAAHGLTQQQFADLCGLSKATIAHLETEPNKRLSVTTRMRIEYVLAGKKVEMKQRKRKGATA